MTVFVISFIRTQTPALVAAFFAWLISLGIVLPVEAELGLIAFLTAVLTGAYYAVVRLFEEKYPQVGILLGFPKSPDSYSKGPGVVIDQKPNGSPEITLTINEDSKTQESTVYVNRLTDGPDHRA